ncbi:unnamed protein product [Caenorhabditis angaria]|uniref:Uncharacterized protein n=1 Tax=Caenorhabditis angaria TaxID=860376 RepID=A0A9P1I3Y1_9PELO|nr:unnamed protein product [Caenorhabditis angaria]
MATLEGCSGGYRPNKPTTRRRAYNSTTRSFYEFQAWYLNQAHREHSPEETIRSPPAKRKLREVYQNVAKKPASETCSGYYASSADTKSFKESSNSSCTINTSDEASDPNRPSKRRADDDDADPTQQKIAKTLLRNDPDQEYKMANGICYSR